MDDLEQISWDSVSDNIGNSRFSRQMNRLMRAWSYEHSNCFGTVAHLLDVENEIQSHWESIKEQEYVRSNMIELWDHINLSSPTRGMPGYIGPMPMKLFLASRHSKRVKKINARDKAVAFFDEFSTSQSRKVLLHTALYLGAVNKEEMIFHQSGSGGVFERIPLLEQIKILYFNSSLTIYKQTGKLPYIQFYDLGS